MSARRIVDAALLAEAEGMEPDAALAAALESIRVTPAAESLARRILASLDRRARRVEVVLPDRDRRGRFYLGVPEPRWLGVGDVRGPVFISAAVLERIARNARSLARTIDAACHTGDECELCGGTWWAAGDTGTNHGGLSEQIGVECPRGCEPEGEA